MKRANVLLALLFTVACAKDAAPPAHAPHAGMHHDFSDAARWSQEFDAPSRDAWQKPDEVVRLLELAEGMTVADVGAGTGYFERRLAAAVGPNGRVLALDIEPNLVDFMRDRFAREGLRHVEARRCPEGATGLGPGSVDRVLVVDTWHHLDRREAYAAHLAATLRPGGLVVVVDYTLESEKGPPKHHRLAPGAVIAELAAGGLRAQAVAESLPDQYVVVARKP